MKVAQNAEFKQALTNTIFLCLITVPVSTILALLIAFSRLYLFLHFPSDVAAGILLGIPIGLAAGLLCLQGNTCQDRE